MSSTHSGRDDETRRKEDKRHRGDSRHSRSRSHSRRKRDEVDQRSYTRDDHHGRSRSKSRSRRNRRSYSRSHSRSVDRSKRRQNSQSRSGSNHRKSSRRYGDSRSRSRSRSHSSRVSNKHSRNRYSSSRSPRPYDRCQIKKKEDDQNKPQEDHSDSESRKSMDEDNYSSQYYNDMAEGDTLENLPLPEQTESNSNTYEYVDDSEEPIDKERIHREIEEKLRLALAKEGKVYPPPKPEASHPVFANDGSFLEIFKKMQEAQQTMTTPSSNITAYGMTTPSTSATAYAAPTMPATRSVPPPPLVGRRRGGKILKTGVVAKPKVSNANGDDKDFWSLYLAEVNKYKNNACELNSGNRPLLK